ncbi:hypothetical protein ACFY5D_21240 [Paeniglutamicibacter sp. NPDC012692]|uniref:hypothetical protein n=1 Tax=Paeniglutamicibacter sp. NPDC012692 TaxID=3364388 RepID=UPI0036901491
MVLHRTKNGDLANKTSFKIPTDTTVERLPMRTSDNGNTAIIHQTWANLKAGTFGAPQGIDLAKIKAIPRLGGMELQASSENTFRLENGTSFSVPNKGSVLAVTKEVVILEESRLVSVYGKTTTEGTK